MLWLQETLARKKLPLRKVPGVDNMSDLMTKNVEAKLISHHITNLGMEFVGGRPEIAAQVSGVSSEPCGIPGTRGESKGSGSAGTRAGAGHALLPGKCPKVHLVLSNVSLAGQIQA